VALLWLLLVTVAANPAFFGLPGSYLISNGAVVIALWLPAAALAGGGFAWAIEALGRRLGHRRRWLDAAAAPAILVAGLALSGAARDTLNPGTVLATPGDRQSLAAVA